MLARIERVQLVLELGTALITRLQSFRQNRDLGAAGDRLDQPRLLARVRVDLAP